MVFLLLPRDVKFCIASIFCILKVAERQGKYLAALLNKIGREGGARAGSAKEFELGAPFVYKHLGSMATIGRYKALVDLRQSKVSNRSSCSGVPFFLALYRELGGLLVIIFYRKQRG